MNAERKPVDVLAEVTVEIYVPSDRQGYWWVVAAQGDSILERMSCENLGRAKAERDAMRYRWEGEQRAAMRELIEAATRVVFAPINTCDGNPSYAEVERVDLGALTAALARCGVQP